MKPSNKILNGFLNLESSLKISLTRDLFENQIVDSYHGIGHTTRVLFGSYLLTYCIEKIDNEVKEAIFYACIIHDLGRTHEGQCLIHGEKSVKQYQTAIRSYISNDFLYNEVIEAVKYHSIKDEYCPNEVRKSIIFKILKDADALDRGRFQQRCDRAFLRMEVFNTKLGDKIINFMYNLSNHTQFFKWKNPYKELIDCIVCYKRPANSIYPIASNRKIIKTLYHGTSIKLKKGDFLTCNSAFNSNMTQIQTCIFATNNLEMAKFFGIRSCLVQHGVSILKGKNIYLDKVRDVLLNQFYIYSVNSKDFILDKGYEYIKFSNTKITNVLEVKLTDEIKTGGWEIFLFNNELPSNKYGNITISDADEDIKNGKYKKIDVLKMIEKQYSMDNFNHILS